VRNFISALLLSRSGELGELSRCLEPVNDTYPREIDEVE